MKAIYKKAIFFGSLVGILITIIDLLSLIFIEGKSIGDNYLLVGFNILFWVVVFLISFFLYHVISKKFRRRNLKALLLSFIFGLILYLNVAYIINKTIFKTEWLAKVVFLNFNIPSGLFSFEVLLINLGTFFIFISITYILYNRLNKLRRKKIFPFINISIALLLVEFVKNNQILRGDVSFSFLISKLIIIGVIILIAYVILNFNFEFKIISITSLIILILSFVLFFSNSPIDNYFLVQNSEEAQLTMIPLVKFLDFDQDSFVTFYGSYDCDNRNSFFNVLARDIPNNNFDEDCSGSSLESLELDEVELECLDCLERDDYNVVFILIDTLRADHLSFYGYERNTSPNIDKLAKNSLVFKKVIATSSWTVSSLPSIFTSLYPWQHETYYLRESVLENEFLTLPEILQSNDYNTAAFIPYDEVVVQTEKFMKQGFDIYLNDFKTNEESYMRADELNNKVFNFLDNNDGKFFAYIHYADIHLPYNPPEPFDKEFGEFDGKVKYDPRTITNEDLEFMKAGYDSSIKYIDNELGELFSYLEDNGLMDNTIIVIASDHGEEFLEHGNIAHARTLYSESINVPLIIKYPGSDEIIINEVVSIIDIAPTILDILDIEEEMQGLSLIPLMKDSYGERFFYSEIRNKAFGDKHILFSIQNSDFKYIYNVESGLEELYNIRGGEENNLINEFPGIAQEFKWRLFDWMSIKN